ncbi:4Fe-4S binding protein, partial [Rhodopirellula sp.]
ELASCVVVMMAAVVQFGGVRQIKRIRWIWLILVVVVIGFWTGHFVSISLIAGWSAEGVAWRVAPGLALVAAAAFLFPMLTKQNLYCNHLCPHGAVQQLVKPSGHSPRRRRLNATVANWFRQVPGIVLVCAYVAIVLRPSIELSNWEPFHAYLFRIASWSSLVFAGLSLLVAAILPMAYCRFGCPTGRLLDYLRFNARSGSLKRADLVVLVLVLFATIAKLVD